MPEDKQTRDYHDNFTTFLRKNGNRKTVALIALWDSMLRERHITTPFTVQNRERVPAKGYISDQLTDEAIGVVDRAKTLDQPFMLYGL